MRYSARRNQDASVLQCTRCGKTVKVLEMPLEASKQPAFQHSRLHAVDGLLRRLCTLSDTIRHVAAGAVARTMSQFVIHPLDTIKTRLQINKNAGVAQLRLWRTTSKKVPLDLWVGKHRVVHCRNVIYRGPRDLYLGVCGAVLGTLPMAAVYFASYEWCKAKMEVQNCSKAATHVASASFGAVLSAFIKVPSDTLKHQVQAYLWPSTWQGASGIIRQEGIAGLYHGLIPTMMRDVPELAIQFLLYEQLRQTLERHKGEQKLHTYEHLSIGALSGGLAATATTPMDAAKTALQCGGGRSLREVLTHTIKERGMQGLFAGMAPRVAQTAIMSAVFFTLFEAWKGQLKQQRAPEDCMLAPKIWRKRRGHVWKRLLVGG